MPVRGMAKLFKHATTGGIGKRRKGGIEMGG
jgi:hypothetical protein